VKIYFIAILFGHGLHRPRKACIPTGFVGPRTISPWSLTSRLYDSAARRDTLCWLVCVLGESQDVRGGIQGSAWETETCQPKLLRIWLILLD